MFLNHIRTIFISLWFVSFASVVLADATKKESLDDYLKFSLAELGQIKVSIATGISTSLDKTPATATVIGASEIDAMGAHNLDEILETVPGLHVSLSTLSRLDSVYSIRGIHTGVNSEVLLMLNGVPVQSALQGGRPTLFRLPVSSIERVEVIRGPGSAVYGADAYSGVINVITKSPQSISGTQMGGRSGSFNSHDIWVQSAAQWHDVDFAFNLDYQESDGDPKRIISRDQQSLFDSVFHTQASHAPAALSTRYQVFDAHFAVSYEQSHMNLWHWQTTNAGIGAGGAQALDPAGRDDNSLWMADVDYHFNPVSDVWDNSIHASYLYVDMNAKFTLFPAGAVLPIGVDGNINYVAPVGLVQFPDGLMGNPASISKNPKIDLISVYSGNEAHRVRAATGVMDQQVSAAEDKNFGPGVIDGTQGIIDGTLHSVTHTEYVYLPESSRRVHYFSLQDEWQLASNWGVNVRSALRSLF